MDNLTTSVPGNITTDLKANSTAGQLTPNFGISNGTGGPVTFLDDFQVNILLRATQISQNTTTLTAPRLTLFNGQYAYVAVSTDTAYVSDLTPVVANGAVAFDPTVAIVQSGVILLVRATVSDNKKYVTLTLRPTLQRLRGLTSFPISAVSNVTGVNSNTTQITTANIQQPVQDVTTLATTVSVPDRGTLLLGGQTLAGEIERDSGVPILSKIPFLKRLFTNSSMAKDEQVLLILVKPTIVIQQEQEQDQFPTMSSKY
jgi:general secretion pathway protein D